MKTYTSEIAQRVEFGTGNIPTEPHLLNENTMKSRKGIVKIQNTILSNINNYNHLLLKLFSEFIPIKINTGFNCCEYYGYSNHFDEISEGCKIPEYDVTFTQIAGDIIMKINKI